MTGRPDPQMRLDHLGLVSRQLEPLLSGAVGLGFQPTRPEELMAAGPTGPVPLEQSSAHLVFGNTYVELTAVRSHSPAHHLAPWLARREGLLILAFGTEDLAEARRRSLEAGYSPGPVAGASRRVTYGLRAGEARFEWFMLDSESTPEALVCFVRHLTPEVVFQSEVQQHPNGARDIEGVVLVTDQPLTLAGRYAGLTGGQLTGSEREARVVLESGWLEFRSPESWAALTGHAPAFEGPGLAGFSVLADREGVDQAGLPCRIEFAAQRREFARCYPSHP